MGDTGLDRDLLAALRDPPERQREAIAFRVFLDLHAKATATATATGIAPGTVNAHLDRGVAILRGHFVNTDNDEGSLNVPWPTGYLAGYADGGLERCPGADDRSLRTAGIEGRYWCRSPSGPE